MLSSTPTGSRKQRNGSAAMSDHTLRHPDMDPARGIRDAIRRLCPNGSAGFVAEDLDLVIRTFGPDYGSDSTGKFALIEVKFGQTPLGASKAHTFGLIDKLLRDGDPSGARYLGFFVLRHQIRDERPWGDDDVVDLNGTKMTILELTSWLQTGTPEVQPVWLVGR